MRLGANRSTRLQNILLQRNERWFAVYLAYSEMRVHGMLQLLEITQLALALKLAPVAKLKPPGPCLFPSSPRTHGFYRLPI